MKISKNFDFEKGKEEKGNFQIFILDGAPSSFKNDIEVIRWEKSLKF